MRATSTFIFECGISAVLCLAIWAFRILVRKSAIGSFTAIRLPTRFRDARDLALVRQLPQADPAQPELPIVPLRPATPLAPVVLPDLELLRLLLLYQQSFSRHITLLARPERHTQHPQKLRAPLIGLRRRHNRHVETARGVYRVVGDLREDRLLP